MSHRTVPATALITATMLITGCTNAHHVDVMTVLSHGNCQTNETGVHLIDYATLATYRGAHLIGMTESADSTQNPAHLIAIAPAQYPTAGYRVQLQDGSVLSDKRLTLTIKVDGPPADAMLAQMITHPCLVVGIADPAVGSVRVMNGAEVLGEVDLPASK